MGGMFPLVIFLTALFRSATAAQDPGHDPVTTDVRRPLVVLLDVRAATWRPRGRISFGLVPSLRMKLSAAGLRVVEDPQEPHDARLIVKYREERGKPISVHLSGTEITCDIELHHPERGEIRMTIHETPGYDELVNAPYVEVVEKLQANPYFYFLGDLIQELSGSRRDTTGALIEALRRHVERERNAPPVSPFDTLVSPSETFPDLDRHYAPWAQQNTVEELGRLKDARAIPLLVRMLSHEDRHTRLKAETALREFAVGSVRSTLAEVAQGDADAAVRQAAASALQQFAPQ